jgi:hypothetical protein
MLIARGNNICTIPTPDGAYSLLIAGEYSTFLLKYGFICIVGFVSFYAALQMWRKSREQP